MKAISLKALVKKLSNLGFELPTLGKSTSANSTTIEELCRTLLNLKGEASSVAIAEEILRSYDASSGEDKLTFFRFLFTELIPDITTLDTAIEEYLASKDPLHLQTLSKAAESPRQDLFRALNMATDGTQSLIFMREDLQTLLVEHSELKVIDVDFLHLFKSWFNRGFLELRRIDWHTPAEVLEKLIEYESVHEIQGWPDLRRRLEADRRCYGFFHPVMPNTPLIFVEVALTKGLSNNITDLLEQAPPQKNHVSDANTAIFYSINNCFRGLRGISFGNFLIKQVVEDLAVESPEINTYSTLSPIPGFGAWLRSAQSELVFLNEQDSQDLDDYIQGNTSHEELHTLLLKLCAHYLINAKSRNKPKDPVARFHLGNGACLERLNWEANISKHGLKQSAGIMVNYLYDKSTLTRNHEAYEQNDKVVSSNSVLKLLP